MAAPLNKATLLRLRRELKEARAALPALELKRRQMLAWRAEARAECAALQAQLAALSQAVEADLPMLAEAGVAIEGLLRVAGAEVVTESRLGVALPRLEAVRFDRAIQGWLTRPHWVDRALALAEEGVRTRIALEVARRRQEALAQAARKATQRVNVFEKVRIPEITAAIARIELALADAQRAQVVIGKIAKAKRLKAEAA